MNVTWDTRKNPAYPSVVWYDRLMTTKRNTRSIFNPLNADLDSTLPGTGVRVNLPGYLNTRCTGRGGHPACKKAHKEGRSVHMIPPTYREDRAYLSLPSYHFATVAEAEEAYMRARKEAIVVHNVRERDEELAKGRPVWVPFDVNLM